MTTGRRHRVTYVNARAALLKAGFVQHIWPTQPGQPRQWILTWHNRHHLIKVVIGLDRGHQTVILGHHDGQRWHADDEQRYSDHVGAVRAALAALHRIRAEQERAA